VVDITTNGLINPLTVRPDPAREGHYLLVCGFRRYQALGAIRTDAIRDEKPPPYQHLDVRVFHGTLEQARILTLAENHDRRDLSAWELGDWCMMLRREHDLTGENIAQRVGYAKSTVNHAIAYVTKIHPDIQTECRASRVRMRPDHHDLLQELVRLDHERQKALWQTRMGSGDKDPSSEGETDPAAKRAPIKRVLRSKLAALDAAKRLSPTPEVTTAWGVLRWALGISKRWPVGGLPEEEPESQPKPKAATKAAKAKSPKPSKKPSAKAD
jgi:ParB-like chromosome segregation protein Spo0J